MSWIRRGRVDADNWISADIPLDEPWERYRVQVLKGDIVLRQVDVAEAAWQYAAADELSDFGKQQAQLKIRIAQLGQRVPLGIPATALVAF
jgi:predicted negative regulator of RcsB-dependent stress response